MSTICYNKYITYNPSLCSPFRTLDLHYFAMPGNNLFELFKIFKAFCADRDACHLPAPSVLYLTFIRSHMLSVFLSYLHSFLGALPPDPVI